jgi:hypothetical protein
MSQPLYTSSRPIDRKYAKALQLLNSRTDFAWKHLKESNHAEVIKTVRQIRDISIKFLDSLAHAAEHAARNGQGKKTIRRR